MESTETKHIWVVEDHVPFRRTLAKVLNAEAALHCSAAFDSCERALEALADSKAEQPDVILLDVGLPGMSGLEGIRLFRERSPHTLVIILTVFEDDEKIFQAICAGASGYLLKTAGADAIVQAIHDALAGGSPMNPRIARRVLEMFSRLAPKKADYGLSEREKEILQHMVKGLIKKEIADRLQLSVHTVDTYLRRIYEKLEVNTRTGAVAKALKEGLV
ncbi:LuxR family two component transcriptional regulator [Roseimicrobium gellanilyticum]|uniref:LuxR family two component transcriptional regulator n=1 Tax=Roseimicrobium gellanilyticum TaxID=748857 RepID=A0A366HLB9_9BACT|nr:response regulator transcription factor [Roseimicrobium gellanilyticum]RBP42553.1 LuxR family two component transcriptional regulator [Roseimicrobium gellanilyticum]